MSWVFVLVIGGILGVTAPYADSWPFLWNLGLAALVVILGIAGIIHLEKTHNVSR